MVGVLLAAACGRETRMVAGTSVVRYSTEDGVVEQPVDLSGTRIAVLAPAGDGYEEIEGEGFDDGTFVVLGVPLGTYYLIHDAIGEKGIIGFEDERDRVEIVSTELGRPDRVWPDQPPLVTLDVGGLSPWQRDDSLSIASPDVAVGALLAAHNSSVDDAVTVEEGATEIRGASLRWTDSLIEASKGDRAYLFQSRYRDLPVPYKAVNRAGEVTGLDVGVADESVIAGDLADVAQDKTFELSISPATIVESVRRSHPLVDSAWTWVSVEAQPRWRTIGYHCGVALLSYGDLFGPHGPLDPVKAELAYGDPLSEEWDRFVTVEVHAGDLEGSQTFDPGGSWGHVYRTMALDRVGNASLAPLVTAPQGLAIDGYDGFAGPRGVGETPELSWSPPAEGNPSKYEVAVYRSFERIADDGVEWHLFETLVEFDTTETRLVIPEGLLESGNLYFAVVTAWAGDELDRGSASVVTSLFAP